MKILLFTDISPFPINGGACIRTYGLLKAFSELGHEVDAIINNSEHINLKDFTIKNVRLIEYNSSMNSIFNKITCLHYFRKKKDLIKLFKSLIQSNKPDIVFLDYGFVGQYITYFKNQNIPVIYGTHNSQSDLTRQQPIKGGFKTLRNLQYAFTEKLHEHLYFIKADQLIVVSEEDKKFHAKFIPVDKIKIIPNFLDENRYQGVFEKEDYFVITANFGAYMNYEGLKWLVNNVWDESLDKKIHLKLVGVNSNEALASLPKAKEYSNIVSYGSVEDITPFIGKAKAVLIPLLHGSGSRLKCLEAMALSTLIISTTKGVEGIKSESIITADTPEEFRNEIISIKQNSILGKQLNEEFNEHYSIKNNKFQLEKVLKQAII